MWNHCWLSLIFEFYHFVCDFALMPIQKKIYRHRKKYLLWPFETSKNELRRAWYQNGNQECSSNSIISLQSLFWDYNTFVSYVQGKMINFHATFCTFLGSLFMLSEFWPEFFPCTQDVNVPLYQNELFGNYLTI